MLQKLLAKRALVKNKAAAFMGETKNYYKENPAALKTDAVTAVITLLLCNIESEIDDLEEHTGISAAVDYHTYNS